MDTPKTNEKNTLPHSTSKQGLVKMYLDQMSEKMILDNINEIILDNRKKMPSYKSKTPRQIIGSSKVLHKEFMEFVETFGTPKGYSEPENTKL